MVLPILGTVVGFIAFSATVAVLAFTPFLDDSAFNKTTRIAIIASFSVYVVVTGVNLLSIAGLSTELLGEVEAYAEVLFPILALFTLFSSYSNQQMRDIKRAQRAMQASQALTSEIIDLAPAGILLLNQAGQIVFANETARDILDLHDDPDTCDVVTADWTVTCADGGENPDFSGLLGHDIGKPVRCKVMWPSGWVIEIDVSTQQMGSSQDSLPRGYVATFERPRMGVSPEGA